MVDLSYRVRELAATVGAVLDEADVPSLWLDRQWRPDLPAALRHELEAHAILRADHAPGGWCWADPPHRRPSIRWHG